MSGKLLSVYHRLPPFARNIAASIRGVQLRMWRYGPETDGLVKAAHEREHWPVEKWTEWQQERLSSLLISAAENVPYYRDYWGTHKAALNTCSPGELTSWPILNKQTIRHNPAAFLANPTSERLKVEQTSGTSGTPLRISQSRTTARNWYALAEARWRGWYGVSRDDRWAILGGQLVAPVNQQKPPFWVWNACLNQLYLSSYHLSPATCTNYLDAMSEAGVKYLLGYASAMHALSMQVIRQGLRAPVLKVAISNAEPLLQHQRECISKAFKCPVRDTYGMTEMVAAASECEEGTMHLWPEAGLMEILADDTDSPVSPGTTGRIVCTGLLNNDMPLIRYDLGDRGAVAPPSQRCSCGRMLPILLSVDGRQDEVVVTPLGRRVGRLDPVFKADFAILEAQIVQEARTKLLVKVVPASGFNETVSNRIAEALRERVGDMSIEVQTVNQIPRGPNGKFRSVISLLKPDDRI